MSASKSLLLFVLLGVSVLCLASPPPVAGQALEILAPTQLLRASALPVAVELRFNVPIAAGSFKAILNGKDVSSRFLVGPTGGAGDVSVSDGLLSGEQLNSLKILAKGQGGQNYSAHRQFSVFFPRVAAVQSVISPNGGSLILAGIGTVVFGAGSFDQPTRVEFSIVRQAESDLLLREAAGVFDSGARASYELSILADRLPNVDAEASLEVPAEFRVQLPANAEVRVFGRNIYISPIEQLETFELLAARALPSADRLAVTIPASLFSSEGRNDGRFRAVLSIGSTPTRDITTRRFDGEELLRPVPWDATLGWDSKDVQFTGTNSCSGTSLRPPVANPEVTSHYGPRPGVGAGPFHYGTDFRAPNGTDVLAMADGVIERVTAQAGNRGWGKYVVLRHTDGSKSLYAHLDRALFPEGSQVRAGDVIALSDSSGGVTGPHLHVEYAPNGTIYAKDGKVDLEPCMGVTISGAITVRDNGNLADDAFRVSIDGRVVCETSLGATNTCAVGNLRPGRAILTITAIVAPDNVGTYEITLADGLSFDGGGTRREGTLAEGQSASFGITIPDST